MIGAAAHVAPCWVANTLTIVIAIDGHLAEPVRMTAEKLKVKKKKNGYIERKNECERTEKMASSLHRHDDPGTILGAPVRPIKCSTSGRYLLLYF